MSASPTGAGKTPGKICTACDLRTVSTIDFLGSISTWGRTEVPLAVRSRVTDGPLSAAGAAGGTLLKA